MAEINAAYAQLRDAPLGGSNGTADRCGAAHVRPAATPAERGRSLPGWTRPTRSDPRNATTSHPDGRRAYPPGQPPIRSRAPDTGPRRASDPNGPLVRSRVRRFRPPTPPSLAVARATEMPFGKFHGHTLGEIAAFEPSYIDWMASTITREPDLLAAARVLRDDLDARGVVRRLRPLRRRPRRRPTDRTRTRRSPPVPSGAIVWKSEER